MYKFLRQYSLRLTTEDGETLVVTNPFTLDFNITKKDLSSSSQAEFKIYNLSQDIRDRIFRDRSQTYIMPKVLRMPIEFYAGYEGFMPMLFKGEIKVAKSYRMEGSTSYITEVTANGYGDAEVNGFSNFTVAAGTSKRDVILRLISDLNNVSVGYVSSFAETYQRPVSFCDNTASILRRETGNRFYVDLGRAFAVEKGDYIQGDLTVINSQSGLLGVPSIGKRVVTAEILFEPRILMKQLVALETEDYKRLNNRYQIVGINHSGTISDAVGGKAKTTVRMKTPNSLGAAA